MLKVAEKRPTRKPKRPKKPSKTFPLFPHANGSWAKKVRGKLHYFGGWGSPEAALKLYEHQREDLEAGRTPRSTPATGVATLRDLANHFLTAKEQQLKLGEITPRTFRDYHKACGRVVSALGKDRVVADLIGEDFAHLKTSISKNWGPVTLSNEIQRIRVMFKYGHDSGLLDHPVRYGTGFKRPPKRQLRQSRQANGSRMFEAAEIRAVLEASGTQMRAMVLLGINAGYGNSDCATVPMGAFDADLEWVEFPRPKTAIERRARLWSETSDALREVLARRRDARDPADRDVVFLTKRRRRWHNESSGCPISAEFRKLCTSLGIHQPGRGFYSLRHVFRTIADGARDDRAVDRVMGHYRGDMASHYIERIDDGRLESIANTVRSRLFSATGR